MLPTNTRLNYRTLAPVAVCPIPSQFYIVQIRAVDGTRFKIKITLKKGCVSFTGEIFNKWAKTPHSMGQIVDDLEAYGYTEQAALWREWHLNDMQVGTDVQQEAVREIEGSYAYKCTFLAHAGLLIDRGFKYGSGWLMKEITQEEWIELLAVFDRVAAK